METRRDVFQAIADPNRRAILGLLAKKNHTLNGVAENFDISRPAISRHIKILTECGLVVITQQGRERYCEARFNKLEEVTGWVEQYRKIWDQRLDKLEAYLDEIQAAPGSVATQGKRKPGRKATARRLPPPKRILRRRGRR